MSVRFPEGQAGNPQVGKIPTGPHAGKNIFDKDVPLDDTIKGLLKMMPVGARTATYIPAEAVEQMSLDSGKDVDISSFKGVVSFNDGPYVEDWSKVPAEIAAKYNTAPR
mmetsp:Transcript_27205/g.72023  ORF Transcript_27205/g.72023 Transcript_27205/m.72023 type:complete len:109 (+) Transcript_27205:48-374(+)